MHAFPFPILIQKITPYEEFLIKFLRKFNMLCEFPLDLVSLIAEWQMTIQNSV